MPAIAVVAKGKLALLLDSRIRRGTDILKVCALGADAVLLGRATLYGMAVGGQAGAGHALDRLAQELRLALSLLGLEPTRQSRVAPEPSLFFYGELNRCPLCNRP